MSAKSLKNIGIVASATIVSRVLGLVREVLIAAVFGTSALNSAFVSAFTLPNLFRRLLGEGALTAAFVPTMTDELEHRQREGAFALLSKVASRLLAVTAIVVAVSVLIFANADFFLRLAGRAGLSEATSDRLRLGADLAVIVFPYMVFVCLAAAFSAACQVLGRFTEPALSPIWLNVAIIAALGVGGWWAMEAPTRMNLLCVGALVGGFFQMAVPAGVMVGQGWRPRFDLRSDERVREIMRLMAPTVLGSAIYLVNISISRFIGLSLNDHAASVLNLATRVMELPIGVFAAAISTVVFPLIARHASRAEWGQLGVEYHKGMRLVLAINVPAAVGLMLLSEPIVRLLFQRGQFHPSDTALMTPILAIYAGGLPFLSFTSLALRGFYSVKDTATPVRAAALSFVVNLVLSIVLMQWLSTAGLALASNLAVVAQAWYLQTRLTRRRPELGFGEIWGSLARILVAAAAMGLAVWGGGRLLAGVEWRPKLRDLLTLGLLIPAACAFYGALLWMLKIEGRDQLAALIRRVLGSKVRATGEG